MCRSDLLSFDNLSPHRPCLEHKGLSISATLVHKKQASREAHALSHEAYISITGESVPTIHVEACHHARKMEGRCIEGGGASQSKGDVLLGSFMGAQTVWTYKCFHHRGGKVI